MSNSKELPKYKCHKEVWALKIAKVENVLDFPEGDEAFTKQVAEKGVILHFEDTNYSPMQMDLRYAIKHSPQAGGYFVVYKDNYFSYSPASEFEDGYTLIK